MLAVAGQRKEPPGDPEGSSKTRILAGEAGYFTVRTTLTLGDQTPLEQRARKLIVWEPFRSAEVLILAVLARTVVPSLHS